jgi:soluble lytic murein transglycosylase-like protein
MSTLGSVIALLGQNDIQPYNAQELTANRIQSGNITNQTALLALNEQQQQAAAQAAYLAALQQHPELVLGPQGAPTSTLGALAPGMGAPAGGPGPLTQQAFGPGGLGPAQTVAAPPDLSQFASGTPPGGGMPGAAPPSPLAALAPQMDPLRQLMQQDPRAGLLLQQRMQQSQDVQTKMQEQQLSMRLKVTEYLAKQVQGIGSQEQLEAVRQDLQRWNPAVAARLPQFYSKAAMQPLIDMGQTALENAQTAKALADAQKAQQQAQTEQYTREVMLPKLMEPGSPGVEGPPAGPGGGVPTGQQTAAPAEVETAVQEAVRLYPQVRPEVVRAIIATESNFDPKAVSKRGAKGLMQLMDDTGRAMGVDDPFDTRQNVRGGVRYFAQLLTKYGGDEAKALAAYNAGPGAVDKAGGDLTALPQETQAYVPKVLQRAQVGATARGPATGPQVQRIQAQIADLEGKVKLASITPGMNVYADNLSKQLDRLYKERDRLEEIPRAVEKQTALQKGELEKAGEAERIKAESERATKEEIDAINRTRPAAQKIPYGTPKSELRKLGLVGGELVPPAVLTELSNRSTVVQQLDELSTNFGALPTGPVAGRLEALKQRFGIDVTEEKVAYRQILAMIENQLLQARSGAAINEHEYQRIRGELPTPEEPQQVFQTKLATATRMAKNLYKTKAQTFRKAGYAIPDDLMEPLAAAEAPPAPKPSSNVDKFKAIKP